MKHVLFLIGLNGRHTHDVQKLFDGILLSTKADKKEKMEMLDEVLDAASQFARKEFFFMVESLYHASTAWEQKYAAIDMLKALGFSGLNSFDVETIERVDKLIINALCDDDGRVRQNAFFTVSDRRLAHSSLDIFFCLFDAANRETGKKRHVLCRAMLKFPSPVFDETVMRHGFWKDYHRALDFALSVTGYNPAYYKAGPREKMLMRIQNRKNYKTDPKISDRFLS